MMFRPECCVLSYSLLLYCTMCIDRRLPAPEVDDAASDSDDDEGMARAMIVNRITATTVCLQETI